MLAKIKSKNVLNIYLAGRISKGGWRERLLDVRSQASRGDATLDSLKQTEARLNPPYEMWNCVGPFFISCDHGCYHGDSSHGLLSACEGDVIDRSLVPGVLQHWIGKADHMLVWLDDDAMECHGTLVEIGYALGRGIPVRIGLGPKFSRKAERELWLTLQMVGMWNVFEADSPQHAMAALTNTAIMDPPFASISGARPRLVPVS